MWPHRGQEREELSGSTPPAANTTRVDGRKGAPVTSAREGRRRYLAALSPAACAGKAGGRAGGGGCERRASLSACPALRSCAWGGPEVESMAVFTCSPGSESTGLAGPWGKKGKGNTSDSL